MDQLAGQNPNPGREGGPSRGPRSSKSSALLLAGLVLLVAGILAYLMVSRLDRIDQEVTQLNTQVQQNNRKMDRVTAQASSALNRATQAEASAQEAANERNQAEQAKAQFQQKAQQAEQQAQEAKQQVQAAQQKAEAAQKKAEQYRQAREAELNRLQQALGQIASTRRTGMGLVMTLGSKSIRFAFDKSTLRPKDKEVLSRIAGILSVLKGYQIYVYGYTDDIGTQAYNLKLSQRRAKAVYDYLVKNGLNPNIMTTKGFGKKDPLVPGSSPKARAINRRVEIGIVDSTIKPLTTQMQKGLEPAPGTAVDKSGAVH